MREALADGADFAELEALARRRQTLWEDQRARLAASAFLHAAWDGAAPPERLEDLPDLPLIDKATLREDQSAHPPFGSYLAAPPERIARVHRTSGTTGQAMTLALSAEDAHQTAIVGARAQRAAGLAPGVRVVHCLNYRLWMGGFTDHTTLEAAGATVVPFGVGDSRMLIRTIRELGVQAISCTPSYPAVLERVIADDFPDLAPADLRLELGLFGGEPGLDDPAFRARLEGVWGFQARNANYGVSDVFCNFAAQTAADSSLHFMALDVLHPELIDPDSGAPKPWRAGERGELVLTHMARECQPLARFRTGDVIDLVATDRAPCGRTSPRFRVVGRADDMVVVRGINIFPTQIAACVTAQAGLSGEYRIALPGPGPYDRLPVQAEAAEGRAPDDALARALEARIKSELGVSATVHMLEFGALPRTEGKTRRVVRLDEDG
ncbi:MAG: hypothetical protein RIB45_08220 [Marivibrio sp.]|uniref:phenylacetate--CoA ligase family protein n=1 Tax=Marivibrio sp. TaxID=2039719 RepID=UPI0032EC41A5